MKRIAPSAYAAVARLYSAERLYFPLIGAVLERTQDGAVYASDEAAPDCAFVQHAFGFAQMFGAGRPDAESWLERHALIDKAFDAPKLRLYAPTVPAFLNHPAAVSLRSERQRFHWPTHREPASPSDNVVVRHATSANVAQIEQAFGVVTRFWRTAEDFVVHANAVLTTHAGAPAALCYAAAVANDRAEIDVVTLPEHRNRGFGRLAVEVFNARCEATGIAPMWDCFTNNVGSMMLAQAVGFTPIGAPYAFFTIAK